MMFARISLTTAISDSRISSRRTNGFIGGTFGGSARDPSTGRTRDKVRPATVSTCLDSQTSYFGYMREIAARDAKNRFGQLLDAAQSAPVRVTRKGRAVGVVMSMQQFERLRGAAWERLTTTMDALGEEASAKGLTEARLKALLSDER